MNTETQTSTQELSARATLATPIIRIAQTEAEKREVYRFRYRIYVKEMGRDQKTADHENQMLSDQLDKTALILMAVADGEVVGTARMNFSSDTVLPEEELYEFSKFEALHPGRVSLISKMIIDHRYRRTRLFLQLCERMSIESIRRSTRRVVIATGNHLVGIFARVGFVQYKPTTTWLDYGTSNCMVIDPFDLEHLRSQRSPILPICESLLEEKKEIRASQVFWAAQYS